MWAPNTSTEDSTSPTLAVIMQHKLRNTSLKPVHNITCTHVTPTNIIDLTNYFSSHWKCRSSSWSMVSVRPRLPSSHDVRDVGLFRVKKKWGRWQENVAEGKRVVRPYTCPLHRTSVNSCSKNIHFAGRRYAILHHQHTLQRQSHHVLYPRTDEASICDLFDDPQNSREPTIQRRQYRNQRNLGSLPARARDSFTLPSIQTESGAHPAFCSKGTDVGS